MPTNMLTASAPMAVSVLAALRALGLRNDGTPLLMASTPVSAVQPDANALSARKIEASAGQAGRCVAAARWRSTRSEHAVAEDGLDSGDRQNRKNVER